MLDLLITGILLGFFFSLISLGLTLITGVQKVVNLAHGSFLMLGGYVSYALYVHLGIDPLLSLGIVAPLFFCIGFFTYKCIVNRAVMASSDMAAILLFSISLIIDNTILILFSPTIKSLKTIYYPASISIGEITLQAQYVVDFVFSLILLLFLYIFLKSTYLGLSIRAAAEDKLLAQASGIDTDFVFAVNFGIATAFSGVAGVFIGLSFSLTPFSGVVYLLISLCIIVIGGLGSIVGTTLAGCILGLSYTIGGHFLGVGYQTLIGFLILLTVLVLKPEGILAR